MTVVSLVKDTFQNFVSKLGTERDKAYYNQYRLGIITQDQLEASYRSDWIARKVVDVPPFDMTREWRSWQAKPEQIEKIEGEERRLGYQRKLKQALQRARLYGGSLIIIGTNDADPSKELRVDSVQQGGLKFLHVVSRYGGVYAGEISTDILSPYYGEPSYYQVTPVGGPAMRIHPSRVVRFIGNTLPDEGTRVAGADGWGDPVLMSVFSALMNATATTEGVASLVQELKIDIIRIPDFMKNIGTEEYKSRLIDRFAGGNLAKSVINTTLLDKEEEWDRIEANFAQMPELLRVYLLIASGAADIPATRMLGQSAAGLNATGESDIRNYYDRIRAEQCTELSPTIARLDDIVIRSATGQRDPAIYYNWNPLWQLSETDRADISLKKAQAHQIDAVLGLINSDALRQGRENQLVEDGFYPGFEAALVEAGEAELSENDPDVEEEFETVTADAAPRTLYVRRDVVNTAAIREWAERQGFKNVERGLHATIIYSKTPVDWMKMGEPYQAKMTVAAGGPRLVEKLGDDGAVVLLFASSELSWRHESFKRDGCSFDYNCFQPHITITYELGDVDLDDVEPYRGEIVFGPEIFEEIKPATTVAADVVPRHSYTWLPDTPDRNDYPFIATVDAGSLPLIVDLRQQMSPVEDQHEMESCTADALTNAMEFLHPGQDFSRMFLYYNERVVEGTISKDAGAFTRSGLKVLQRHGVPPESVWAFDERLLRRRPPRQVYEAASKYKIKEYRRLNTLDEMLSCLAQGQPFVFGFSVYQSFESDDTTRTGIVRMPMLGEKSLGGHLTLAAGYDMNKRAVLFKNSYGTSWGDAGYGWIPFEYLTDRNLSDDFWTLVK